MFIQPSNSRTDAPKEHNLETNKNKSVTYVYE